MSNKKILSLVSAASVMLLSSVTATAEESITLRMGDFIPAKHNGVVEGDNVFISEVKRLTQGKVNIEFYPAQQAGKAKEALDLVKYGAIDMYGLGTAYFGADIPLWDMLQAPNLVKSTCDATRAMRAVGDPGGILWDTMYKPHGIRVLSYFVYPPYGPTGSRVEIKSLDDLQGLKLRNAGGLMERTVVALGATPVGITSPEVLQSLQRGTLDSWLGSIDAVLNYKFYEAAKYGVTGFSFGTPGIFMTINEAKFQSLPNDIQNALVEAGKTAEENFCAFADRTEESSMATLQSEHGMTFHTWSDADVAKMNELTSSVLTDWVKDVEANGVPAGEALKQYKAALGL